MPRRGRKKRKTSRRVPHVEVTTSRPKTTLADLIPPETRKKLLTLRDTLIVQVQDAIKRQRAEAQHPWRSPQQPVPQQPTRRPTPPKTRHVGRTNSQTPVIRAPQPAPQRRRTISQTTPKRSPVSPVASKTQKEPFEYWDFPREAPVRESPPKSISDVDKSRFGEILLAGGGPPATVGEELYVIVGLDFGTSSTKITVRLPYEAGEPTIAIPAPVPCRSDDNPYLWQTVLWLKDKDFFFPWPEPRATALDRLKQGLIHDPREAAISVLGTNVAANRAQASTAYLAFVIRYSMGWLRRNRQPLFRQRKPIWFVNVGMPTASYDDEKLAKPYRRIAAAALQLAKCDGSITLTAVQVFLDHEDVVAASESPEAAEELGVAVIPEAAAAMTSFAKSTRDADGLYLSVDVGAMTLDACMFRLHRHGNENDLYAFMSAQVRPLGVDSLHWYLSENKTEAEFIEQCDRMLRTVVWTTKRNRDPGAVNWTAGNDLPVFLGGGGATNPLHLKVLESVGPWLQHHASNEGIRLLELQIPDGFDCPEPHLQFGRMAVAWGLSLAPTDIGTILPPEDVEDIPPPLVRDVAKRFVSKDQV